MDLLPNTLLAPGVKVVIDTFIVGIVRRQQLPGAATTHPVQNAIDHLAQLKRGPSRPISLFFGRRQEWFEPFPLLVREFSRIRFVGFVLSFVLRHLSRAFCGLVATKFPFYRMPFSKLTGFSDSF